MTELHILVLALVQGITEFLPISSSGHLVLVPVFGGWEDQGLLMDVAVHVGTLGAVMIYFWRDIWHMLRGVMRFTKGKKDPGAKLSAMVLLATIPVIAAGFFLNKYLGPEFRTVEVIGWTTLGFGFLLYFADNMGLTIRRVEHTGIVDAILIGLAQCLALIPGTSRSGITITAARFLGYERLDAARFSMLLSIPAILGAGSLKGYELYESGNIQLTNDALSAAGLAFVAAFIAIAIMMAWLKRASFTPFFIYRLVLGCGLLYYAYYL
ncbi:Undecaprenyl-diphosphatase 1 [Candidatus Terasakiella magnetica]|uniref:Undecaprenyl-diphosphatase n=1 Tax=Candidatus Terasakiella magnetica TaxID=1867952 RepID=A0A1C3RIR9_9PROT|nr:undecaprenyl-diphosphate phosphatase [Candidatus Terasakiella magnetica]SCA57159.1 Undecaprenyl-diphosphatase 1 [Candidatus Terasakiella magnetica]